MKKYQKAFRIPENLDHYSEKDLKNAERKYIKHALIKGIEEPDEHEADAPL